MRAPLAAMAATVSLLGFGACGGGGGPSSATPPATIHATVLVSQTSVGLVGYSSRPSHQMCLRLPVEIRETVGVAVRLNYVRLLLYQNDAEIERAEVTADDIAALAGTNQVEARGTMTITLDFFFNSIAFTSGSIVVGTTDEHGYSSEFPISVLEVEFYDGVLAEERSRG